jgi:hypothetical protein
MDLDPVITVVEDGVVRKQESVGFERELGLAEARCRSPSYVYRWVPHYIGWPIEGNDDWLAGIFTQGEPPGGGQFKCIVRVERLRLCDGRPFRSSSIDGPGQEPCNSHTEAGPGRPHDERTIALRSAEGSHVQNRVPGLFFGQHERNKRGHICAGTSVLQNPE